MISTAMLLAILVSNPNVNKIKSNVNLERLPCQGKTRRAHASETIFFGDSITQNWQNEPTFKSRQGWKDAGRGGETAENARYRVCSDVVQINPLAVHLMYGTNDLSSKDGPRSIDQIANYIFQIALALRARGIPVVIGSVLPTKDFPWHPGLSPAPKVVALNAKLQAFAQMRCFSYANYWPALASTDGGLKKEFSLDGVHPNGKGYSVMLPIAERSLTAAKAGCK